MNTKKIYCCGCGKKVKARLAFGGEIYPLRSDLSKIPFWKCDACNNYVGTHHKDRYGDRLRPLGSIPTPEVRKVRSRLHDIMDPIWQNHKVSRKSFYKRMSTELGYDYHNGEVRSSEEAEVVIAAFNKVVSRL